MSKRSIYSWVCGGRSVILGERTWVMGILNTTPDSFSDGGDFLDIAAAVERALEMVTQGADIIDVGGESTRPGADPVSLGEELERTIPVISKLRAQSDVLISIDTMKAEVAEQALEAGADIINDVSAFKADARMVKVAAQSGAGVVLMHKRGTPQTMQDDPSYDDVVAEVGRYLAERIDFAVANGILREQVVVDPGIGFGKTLEHNLDLLRALPALGAPLLIGASRKRMIGEITGRTEPSERVAGSLGVAAWAVQRGAHILRVHDVIDTCDLCKMLDKLADGDT